MRSDGTTKRFCQACIFQKAGVKTRKVIPHTCEFKGIEDGINLITACVKYANVVMNGRKKILIIGQAPPAVKQELPYDTTMLYDWLNEIGISKNDAQEIFDFDAVYGEFPGFDENGGHKKPTWQQMLQHYTDVLEKKIKDVDKVIILGNVAKDFFVALKNYNDKFVEEAEQQVLFGKKVIYLIHPSKRNFSLYQKSKENILNLLKSVVYDKLDDGAPEVLLRHEDTGDGGAHKHGQIDG